MDRWQAFQPPRFGQKHSGRAEKAGENARTDKTPVLSLINTTTGEVRSAVVPNVTGAVLAKVIASQVSMSASTLYTDSGAWTGNWGENFVPPARRPQRRRVRAWERHDEPRRGLLLAGEASIDGTHHHVSVEHLPRYLAEFDGPLQHGQDQRYSTHGADRDAGWWTAVDLPGDSLAPVPGESLYSCTPNSVFRLTYPVERHNDDERITGTWDFTEPPAPPLIVKYFFAFGMGRRIVA